MSSKEIREHLKKSIDALPDSDIRLAADDLDLYFTYLQARKGMPKNKKLSFAEYIQLQRSIEQTEKGETIPASKVFEAYKNKYGFRL